MILKLETERLSTLEEVRQFVAGSAAVDFTAVDRGSTYEFARRTLVRFDYGRRGKADKGLLRRYLMKATGLSRAQVTRLIAQQAATGRIVDRRGGAPAKAFPRVYVAADARLLAETDELLGQLSGPATRAVMRREHEVFGDVRYERLAYISNGHLYNLRKSQAYRRQRTAWTRTRPSAVATGERRKPQPDGQPGFVRVDSVHQGDLDGRKGVYEVNLVDEVTQYEFVGAAEAISERFMIPVLEGLLGLFPFAIKGFHADNASRRDAPAPSTSTAASPPCSTSSASSSPARAPAAPTTTLWWRARTAASCADISATPTSRHASRSASTSSPAARCRPT